MLNKFMSLDPDKRDKIIVAAMKEFADKGFERASTNKIVNEAGISKGLLFHYFKNKKQLYMFLYDYAIGFMLEEYYKRIDLGERDLFKILENSGKVKLDIMKRNPHVFPFLQEAYFETSAEVKDEMNIKGMQTLQVNIAKIFENVDLSRLKPGLDLWTVINIITWTAEGFANAEIMKYRHQGREIDYDEMFAASEHYFKVLEKCFSNNTL